jgi:DNA-binding transcriptional regulator YhcF (GntR family)
VNFSADRPIYLQIAESIRAHILTGTLKPGDQLMSTTQCATQFRINPATANKAYSLLVADGVVEKRRGIGMFVTPAAPEILRSAGRQRYVSEVLAPALDAGLMLGFTASELSTLSEEYCGTTWRTPSNSKKKES